MAPVPNDINTASIEDIGEEVANSSSNVLLTKDEESIKYQLKISEGSLDEEDKQKLTEYMKAVCGDKQIEKIRIQTTTEDDFEKMAHGEIVTIDETQSRSRLKRSGCSEIKVIVTLSMKIICTFYRHYVHQIKRAAGGGPTAQT